MATNPFESKKEHKEGEKERELEELQKQIDALVAKREKLKG
jgi:hypothetical protein